MKLKVLLLLISIAENMYIQDLNSYIEKKNEYGSNKVPVKDLLENVMFRQFEEMMWDLNLSKKSKEMLKEDRKQVKYAPWFVESPCYSSEDEELNDQAFHELRPKKK